MHVKGEHDQRERRLAGSELPEPLAGERKQRIVKQSPPVAIGRWHEGAKGGKPKALDEAMRGKESLLSAKRQGSSLHEHGAVAARRKHVAKADGARHPGVGAGRALREVAAGRQRLRAEGSDDSRGRPAGVRDLTHVGEADGICRECRESGREVGADEVGSRIAEFERLRHHHNKVPCRGPRRNDFGAEFFRNPYHPVMADQLPPDIPRKRQ